MLMWMSMVAYYVHQKILQPHQTFHLYLLNNPLQPHQTFHLHLLNNPPLLHQPYLLLINLPPLYHYQPYHLNNLPLLNQPYHLLYLYIRMLKNYKKLEFNLLKIMQNALRGKVSAHRLIPSNPNKKCCKMEIICVEGF